MRNDRKGAPAQYFVGQNTLQSDSVIMRMPQFHGSFDHTGSHDWADSSLLAEVGGYLISP
jgi:hypothetical protein